MSKQANISSLRIGLTGGIASGKSSAAQAFKNLGIEVISADEIAKNLLQKNSPALKQVVQKFGLEILTADYELDRKKLRELIFNDSKKRKILDAITHPAIREKMINLAQSASSPYVVLEIPLLIESGMQSLVNRILVVTTEANTQLKRIMQRDNCSLEHAKNILKAQTSNETRLQYADDCILNSGSFYKLNNQVQILHQKYLSLIKNSHPSSIQAKQMQKTGLDLH